MTQALQILVVETEQGAASEAERALTAAGHVVRRCAEPGAPAFPCAALDDRSACPLEGGGVDVALTVRSRPRSQPAPLEAGLSCAIKHHVPVVVAGSTAFHPFGTYSQAVVEGEDVLDAVQQAAGAPMAAHEAAGHEALGTLLALHGHDATAGSVRVRRRRGGLRVSLAVPEDLERRVRDMAAVRAIAAIRRVDPDAAGIDVEVTST